MDFKKICYNCLKEKNTAEGPCPYCGFNNDEYKYSNNQLAPMTPLNGRYMLGRTLGIGGFGITYIALDLHLQVVVAIKELYLKKLSFREKSKTIAINEKDRECFEDNKKRFLQEARVLAMFNERDSEGIVVVKEHFEENNTAYIVMEYLDGITLKKKVADNKLSYEETLKLMEPVCHALDRVHQNGVVHMDVSPDNIMILADGRAKVLDFGGAKNIREQDASDFLAFKRGYAPPEQYVENGNIGAWTDVYATAATIYYCLTGVKPVDSMERCAGAELAPLSKFGVKIPANAEKAIMKALELDVDKRTKTMKEFWSECCVNKEKKSTIDKKTVGVAIGALAVVVAFGSILMNGNKPTEANSTQENQTEEAKIVVQQENYEVGDYFAITLGSYIFENAADRNYIMGIDSGFADNGAALVLKDYKDANCNRFAITDEIVEDGFYNMHIAHTNSYIETADSNELGTVVRQYNEMYNMGTEKWSFVYCGHDDEKDMDLVIIENAAGSVLAPKDGTIGNATEIVLAAKNLEDDSQKWYMRWSEKDETQANVIVYEEGSLVESISGIQTVASALDGNTRLSVTRNEWFAEPTIIVWENVWDTTQQFEFVLQQESRYKIYPVEQLEGEHKCLEYDETSNTIVMRDESDSVNQLFRVVYSGYNTYLLQSYNESVLGFDLAEDGTANGKALYTKPYAAFEDSRFVKWLIQPKIEE